MKTIVNVPSRQNTMRELRDYLMIAVGMVLYGIGWTVFLLPNDITTGVFKFLFASPAGNT